VSGRTVATGGATVGGAASPASVPVLRDEVIDAAIAWSVKLDFSEPAPATGRAFERWLQADPSHALAWQRVGSLRQPFDTLPPELLRTTLDGAQALRRQRLQSRRQAIKVLSLAGLSLGAGWIARAETPWQRLLADASTATGELKTLQLADGTLITLNTDSAVSTDLSGDQRLVVLHRGEILVTTGADSGARRPFWVATPFGRMQALGTRFAVRLDNRRARVSVQQGAVRLHPAAGAAHVVDSGESRWLANDATAPAELYGLAADSWAEGVIAGKNMRLADLLAELARYRRGTIACAESVADLRVSGLFHTGDSDETLQFLAQTQPISVRYHTRFWVAVGPATAQPTPS
jgi:transmembrane sensor